MEIEESAPEVMEIPQVIPDEDSVNTMNIPSEGTH